MRQLMSAVGNIMRQSTRDEDEPLNILCHTVHERQQSVMAKTGHNFYLLDHPHFKRWSNQYHKVPDNFVMLDGNLRENQIPIHVDFDLCMIESVFGHYQIMRPIADRLHLPIIRQEHTDTLDWPNEKIDALKAMQGDVNVFITKNSRQRWHFSEEEAIVIEHGLDTSQFKPDKAVERQTVVMCVANDWIGRGHILGYDIFQKVTQDLPVKIFGDTPGLSHSTASVSDLIKEYQSTGVFLNTSRYSPIPMSVLEAMACGCAVVSTDTCEIPNIIKTGYNGFCAKNAEELRKYIDLCLNDKDVRHTIGVNARQTILDRFNEDRFIKQWDKLFKKVSQMPFMRKLG